MSYLVPAKDIRPGDVIVWSYYYAKVTGVTVSPARCCVMLTLREGSYRESHLISGDVEVCIVHRSDAFKDAASGEHVRDMAP